MKIRHAIPGDAEAVKNLGGDAWAPVWADAAWHDALHENADRRVVLVMEEEGQVLGFIVASFVLDVAEIENLAVATSMRRQGIARQLIAALGAWAVACGIATIELEVHEQNVAARALYAAMGFSEQGRRAKYYTNPEGDAVLLQASAKLLIAQR